MKYLLNSTVKNLKAQKNFLLPLLFYFSGPLNEHELRSGPLQMK